MTSSNGNFSDKLNRMHEKTIGRIKEELFKHTKPEELRLFDESNIHPSSPNTKVCLGGLCYKIKCDSGPDLVMRIIHNEIHTDLFYKEKHTFKLTVGYPPLKELNFALYEFISFSVDITELGTRGANAVMKLTRRINRVVQKNVSDVVTIEAIMKMINDPLALESEPIDDCGPDSE